MTIFTLTDDDEIKIAAWIVRKKEERLAAGKSNDEGASGGAISYEFTPTGIGPIIIVKYFDEELDLTDVENW